MWPPPPELSPAQGFFRLPVTLRGQTLGLCEAPRAIGSAADEVWLNLKPAVGKQPDQAGRWILLQLAELGLRIKNAGTQRSVHREFLAINLSWVCLVFHPRSLGPGGPRRRLRSCSMNHAEDDALELVWVMPAGPEASEQSCCSHRLNISSRTADALQYKANKLLSTFIPSRPWRAIGSEGTFTRSRHCRRSGNRLPG